MVRMFHAKTTSKLYRLRILYFYLAITLYNLWVLLKYRDNVEIPASMLKLHVTLSLVLSFLPDMETGNRHDQQAAL